VDDNTLHVQSEVTISTDGDFSEGETIAWHRLRPTTSTTHIGVHDVETRESLRLSS